MYRYRYVDKQVEIFFLWQLIHKNLEAERSHNLLSANERTRKASGVIQSKYEVMNQESQSCKYWSKGQKR